MGSYNLIDDFGLDLDGGLSVSPEWLIAVVRFRHAVTYRRDVGRGFSEDGNEAVATRGPTLVIHHDCVQMATQTNKSSHMSSLVATLVLGNVNYMAEVLPGDWVLAWIVPSKEKAFDLSESIKNGEACNDWQDGLKFVGRVQSMRKTGFVSPGGQKSGRYKLQAVGFREFDTSVFYDPGLSLRQDITEWLGQIGVKITKFLTKGGADINEAIPSMLDVLFGTGLPATAPGVSLATRPELQITTGLTQGSGEAPFAYVVPVEVGNLLGKKSRSKNGGALAYADLLECNIGLQRFTNQRANPVSVFIPDWLSGEGLVQRTDKPLLGKFLPSPPDLNGKTVWTLLSHYLNPAVNEMYTCLRVNADGQVVPTLVVRQLPFSTPPMEEQFPDDVTPFLELPRWKLHELLVKSWDVGRSDALRFNFVHVYGQSTASATDFTMPGQLVNNPPIRDSMDIKRSGLRMDQMTVACDIGDTQHGPAKWMQIRADFLMGQHLMFTGTLNLQGIYAPICEGDNIEWDGVVYHIESVLHSCTIQPSGQKSFVTSLNVTHGMRADAKEQHQNWFDTVAVLNRNPDDFMYPGMALDDLTKFDPGITREGGDEAPNTQNGRPKVDGASFVEMNATERLS